MTECVYNPHINRMIVLENLPMRPATIHNWSHKLESKGVTMAMLIGKTFIMIDAADEDEADKIWQLIQKRVINGKHYDLVCDSIQRFDC